MPAMTRRYFDWAATSLPESPLLSESLQSSIGQFANPSSRHADGRSARAALEDARSRCAAVLGVDPKTLVFTSGGTESNNLVLQSVLLRGAGRGVIASAIEHPSVAEPLERLGRLGVEAAKVRPEADGRVSPEVLSRAVARRPETELVSVMAVNNETGAVQDVRELVGAVRAAGGKKRIRFHCDAVQAIGKTELDLSGWDVDSAALSAHKIGGPRGIGLLYARAPMEALYAGGEQENGMRAGTENLFGALAFAAVLEKYAKPEIVAEAARGASARWERLIEELKKIDGCSLIPEDRAPEDKRFSPYILQAAFKGIPGEVFVRAMDDLGFSVSTGSACSSRSKKRPVLEAMGIDGTTAFEAVRFSQGRLTTDEDIGALIDGIRLCLRSLK